MEEYRPEYSCRIRWVNDGYKIGYHQVARQPWTPCKSERDHPEAVLECPAKGKFPPTAGDSEWTIEEYYTLALGV
jgi:hypothetical protein